MKRHIGLRAVVTAGIALLVTVAIFRPSTSGTSARLATAVQGLWHWLRDTVAHLTTAQLVEAAALAWLVFVLSLVLLARYRQPERKKQEPQFLGSSDEVAPDAAAVPDITQPIQMPDTRTVSDEFVPPLPMRHVMRHVVDHDAVESLGQEEALPEAPRPRSPGGTAAVLALPDSPAAPESELQEQPAHPERASNRLAARQTRRHLLALSGVSLAQERSLPYGLFIVAEERGRAPSDGNTSQRVVEVVAEQIAPALARDPTLDAARVAVLLKLAVLRADIDARQRDSRGEADVHGMITAILVVGDVVHIVNQGECRGICVYRPREGLLRIVADQAATSRLTEGGPRQVKVLSAHAAHEKITFDVGDGPEASDLITFEVQLQPDDLLLLGSPALWHGLRRTQIEGVLGGATDSRSAAEMLAHTARSEEVDQDVSVIVVHPLGDWMPAFGIAAA
jgi:serine/threonine protein phosphatase PrpC